MIGFPLSCLVLKFVQVFNLQGISISDFSSSPYTYRNSSPYDPHVSRVSIGGLAWDRGHLGA